MATRRGRATHVSSAESCLRYCHHGLVVILGPWRTPAASALGRAPHWHASSRLRGIAVVNLVREGIGTRPIVAAVVCSAGGCSHVGTHAGSVAVGRLVPTLLLVRSPGRAGNSRLVWRAGYGHRSRVGRFVAVAARAPAGGRPTLEHVFVVILRPGASAVGPTAAPAGLAGLFCVPAHASGHQRLQQASLQRLRRHANTLSHIYKQELTCRHSTERPWLECGNARSFEELMDSGRRSPCRKCERPR